MRAIELHSTTTTTGTKMSIHLENELDEAVAEYEAIKAEGAEVLARIKSIALAYAVKHGASDDLRDFEAAMDYLIDDATGPAFRRKVRLENELSDWEAADLRRNAPVVL